MKKKIEKRDGLSMFRFTSLIEQEYDEAVKQLLYFNPGQKFMLNAIVDSLEKFGSPNVINKDGNLRVNLENLDDVQTLFALDDNKLVGLLIYNRFSTETLTIIHIVVHEDYSASGKFSHDLLMLRMLELLRKCARSIAGVKQLRILYGDNRSVVYPV